jgi:hypothetical protein
MKDEQGRPFIVVREYVSKGRNLSSNNASKKSEALLGGLADCVSVRERRKGSMAMTL